MTPDQTRLHRVYAAARRGELGNALWCCANAADAADEASRYRLSVNWKGILAAPLVMPNDDRAEVMVAATFGGIAAANGYNLRDLAELVDEMDART